MDIQKLEQGLRDRAQADFCLTDLRGQTIPFQTPDQPVRSMRVALVSSGGFHLKTEPPFDTDDLLGDPTFRVIPDSTPATDLTISHTHYDHRYVLADQNCALPIDRLHSEVSRGHVGSASPIHLSFMGYCLRTEDLSRDHAPEAARQLQAVDVQGVILAPT